LLAEAEKKQLNFTGPFLFLSDVFIHLKRKKHTILRNTNFSELRTAKLKVKFHFKNDILAIYSIMMTHIAN